MNNDKERQEVSLIGRIFCIEALLILMGVFSFVSGIRNSAAVQIFWGVMIMSGAVVLHFVRKKDWKKHWEEQERLKALHESKEREKGQGKGDAD